MFDEDRQARIELAYSLGHLLDLNFDSKCELLQKFKNIESNRELINSLSEIIDSYF